MIIEKPRMKIRITYILILILLSCAPMEEIKHSNLQPILLATSEAPLGWERLRIFIDSTFEYEIAGFNFNKLYKGSVKISDDSLFFNYINSNDTIGSKAIFNNQTVNYLDGSRQQSLDVTKFRINSNGYDVIPIAEIIEIVKLTIEDIITKYLINSKKYKSRDIAIKEFGQINKSTFQEFLILNKPVEILSQTEVESNQSDYFGIGDWSPVNGKLRLQVFNTNYNTTFNYILINEYNEWKIENSSIF